ncbi:hypothetical protein QJS04_geneDACA003688 [Acorus gramineus]|uniref:Uncharacterized protein n=1 Tax=Acorus gramineus TaxID=55184 RepID=A0AAV9BRK4_ACOGR|nr:hypothetical protein QJS04_geneDACA003688 [Acorus gramineus]
MLRLLREKLLRVSTHGGGTSSPTPKTTLLCFTHGNPSPKSISNISESTPTDPKSFTVSYLTSSCGLSPEAALRASKWVTIKTTKNADLVLDFFRNHGFDQTHIAKVINQQPMLLKLHVERILKPKMDFLTRYGFSSSQLITLVSRDPTILTQKQLVPSLELLKGLIGTQEGVVASIGHSVHVLDPAHHKRLVPNVSALREHGVPVSQVSKLIIRSPNVLCLPAFTRFREVVAAVHGMGIDPSKTKFVEAVKTMVGSSKSTWDGKFEVYKNLGWSEDEILMVFKRRPTFLALSEKKIRRGMEYYTKVLGWERSYITRYPILLSYSLEKRVIPRCSVLQVLLSKGLIKKDLKWSTTLSIKEKLFLERFVTKYKLEAPELMRAYQGTSEFKGVAAI